MIRIDNAVIIPLPGQYIDRGYIVIEKNTILHVGDDLPGHYQQADTVIDASGLLAIPGLINAHTHLAMTLLRGYADDMPLLPWLHEKIWPAEARLKEEDIYWGSMLGILEMIRGGTTSCADMYWQAPATARAIEKSGLRASICDVIIGLHPEADRLLAESIAFCREWQGKADGRITTMLGPHAPYSCPPNIMEKIVDASLELNVGLHIHLSETAAEVQESIDQYGKTPIAMMAGLGVLERPTLAAHCVHPVEDEIDILARFGVVVAHNPGSNMKLGSGIAPVPAMLKAGIKTALGTDGAASNNNLDMFEEMRLAALLHKAIEEDPTVIPAGQALSMATEAGAAALRIKNLGSLKPGNLADIVLINLDKPHLTPHNNYTSDLVYSSEAADVDTVIIDGRIILQGGLFTELDEEEIMAKATKRAKHLLRLPLDP